MNLKGHWLAELGFLTGKAVTVTMEQGTGNREQGRLVIETEVKA
ncbi:SymE family type I addiction module toxin [Symbiopectobacterium purcellii]|nr:SymE family type I addiction module toxin [Symbiopectobacterium purcellii]